MAARRDRQSNIVAKPPKSLIQPSMGDWDSIFRQSFRFPPYSLDALTRQKGYEESEKMLTMAACRAPFNLKRYSILSDNWKIDPAVQDPLDQRYEQAKEYSDFVEWCFSNIVSESGQQQDFRAVLFMTMRAMWDGFSVADVVWDYIEDGEYTGLIRPAFYSHKHAKQIGFDRDPMTGALNYFVSYTPQGGYQYDVPVNRALYYCYNPDSALQNGNGDWRACYKDYLSLDKTMQFENLAVERWGAPVLIMKYPSGSGNSASATAAADTIRSAASVVIPDNISYELVTAPTGIGAWFDLKKKYHAQQIATNIIGNTLSTGEGTHGATSAGSDVHAATGEYFVGGGRMDLEGVINSQIIRRLLQYNFPGVDMSLAPKLNLGGDDETDRYQTAQALQILNTIGNLPSQSKIIRELMNLPPIDADEQKLLEQETAAKQEAEQQIADAKNSGKVAKMSDYECEQWLNRLTPILMRTMSK